MNSFRITGTLRHALTLQVIERNPGNAVKQNSVAKKLQITYHIHSCLYVGLCTAVVENSFK
jgi:hypothetical protein